MVADQNRGEAPGQSHAYQTVLDLVRLSSVGHADHGRAILEILQRVKAHFDLPRAAVCQIQSGRYSVEYIIDDTGQYAVGDTLDLAGSWCQQVVELDQTIMAACAAGSEYERYPGFRTGNAQAYAGARILVDGQLHGTLNVTADAARQTPFDADDRNVLETAAALVGHHVSLQQAEARFDLAVRGSSAGLWDWDMIGNSVYWSPRCYELLGMDPATHTPQVEDFTDLQHPDEREVMAEAIERHLKDRVPYRIEHRIRHADGHFIWVHSRGQAVWDRAGVPQRMAGSIEDITERKRDSEALLRSEERYELAVRGTGVGIWDWDVASGSVFWSEQLKRILAPGIAEPELSIEKFAARIHEDDRDRVLDMLQRHLARETEYRVEYRNRLPDGRVIWVHTRGQAIWNENGEPVRMAGSCHDITERKEAEMRMALQADELRRTNRELEQYASIASHDLQEPLRKITSFGALLARDYSGSMDERGRMLIDRMVDGAQRLRQLIQDLLSYSRSSNDEMQFADVPLSVLVEDVCNDFELTIAETGATITCESDAVLRGDPLLLRQLFHNLLSNSLKYRGEAPPQVSFEAGQTDDGSSWQILVRDNGIGFPSRYAERVFEMFKRLHPRDAYPGTGIGLALCQRVVERHGGRIRVESEPGVGTGFHIEWPLDPAEEAMGIAAGAGATLAS
ncbi:PAS domain-containing protein [Maricaulis sp.]|uniref:PAS domain-containing protein n=1 Tax=Maricaulis sp. TaxID=1486257 RepID=UPI003A9330AD